MINEDIYQYDLNKLNKELLDGIEEYIDESKSINTRKAYEEDWKDFVKFCKFTINNQKGWQWDPSVSAA